MLTIGSCFSGVGGIDLGLELAGLGPTLFQIEIDPFCRSVLEKHWPHADRSITDIRDASAARLPRVDLLCGGSPCQNLSSAGDRSGLGGPKSRLWYEFARLIEDMRTPWLVFENVASGAARWVDTVCGTLAELGYATLPIQVAASDLGAPHRRSRVFIVANLDGFASGGLARSQGAKVGADADHESDDVLAAEREDVSGTAAYADCLPEGQSRRRGAGPDATIAGESGEARLAADAEGIRGASRVARETGSGRRSDATRSADADAVQSRRSRTRPQAFEGRERLAKHSWWTSEPGVLPLVHGLSGGMAGRRRRAAIRALGNSCVPAQAQVAGEVIRILLEAA